MYTKNVMPTQDLNPRSIVYKPVKEKYTSGIIVQDETILILRVFDNIVLLAEEKKYF